MKIKHLSVTSGSHAYGFVDHRSDVDTRGIEWDGTIKDIIGFGKVRPHEDKKTDTVYMTFQRFVYLLAAKTSFTQLDLLFVPTSCIHTIDQWGQLLIDKRDGFLCKRGIMGSCLGFAEGQHHFVFRNQPEERASREKTVVLDDYSRQYCKAQHHSLRTLWQALYCFRHGTWPVRVSDFDRTYAEHLMAIKQQAMPFKDWLVEFESAVAEVKAACETSTLPERADLETWERQVVDYNLWLIKQQE